MFVRIPTPCLASLLPRGIVLGALISISVSVSAAQTGAPVTAVDTSIAAGAATPFSATRRVGATLTSAYVGLGLGHVVLGYNSHAKRFALTQAGGVVAATVGLGLGFAGSGRVVAPALFYGGAALYLGSRAWELADVIVRPARHNARVNAQQDAPPPSSPRPGLALSPAIGTRGAGIALSYRF